MAKTRKRRHSISIDDKISEAQEKLVRTKGRYEKAVETLKALPGFAWLRRGECDTRIQWQRSSDARNCWRRS